MALDVIGMMESDIQKASQKSSGGSASFFVLKSGEKALVRALLDLNKIAIVYKHDLFNPSTGKYEVNAICSDTPELELPTGQCKHCADAKAAKNKKLEVVRYFVIPLYVHQIKNSAGQQVTWTDNDGNEKPVSGVRYLQLKASSDILKTLLDLFRDAGSISAGDLVIGRQGEKLDTKYTVINRPPSAFKAPEGVEIPEQSAESIIARIAELCPFDLLEQNNGAVPPAQSQGKASANDAPDF